MNKLKNILAIFILSLFTISLYSQAGSYGTWTSIGIDKKLKKWDFAAETELRTIYYVRLIDRWSMGVNADYNIFKQLKVGVGYQLIKSLGYKDTSDDNINNNDYIKNYFLRNRFNLSTTGKLKANDFTFTLRERVQLTQKADRVKIDGTLDDYNVNPELAWRNRLQVSYNIPNFKITPSFSVESFFQLNNPDGNTFDNFRYILSFEYKYKKRNIFELYGVYNSELNSDDAYGNKILGLSYKYSF